MKDKFLGSGWKFPIVIGRDGSFGLSQGEEDIKEAMLIILKTAQGERPMRPKFGCNIHNYLFEVINQTTLMQMKEEIQTALLLYEPRIEVLHINSDYMPSKALLTFRIDYLVIATNSRYNLVFPYYLEEGR
jgi:hypothetical protein